MLILIAFALCLVNLVWINARFSETLPPGKRGADLAPRVRNPLRALFTLPDRTLRRANLVGFLVTFCFSFFETTIAFFTADQLNYTPRQLTMVFVHLGVVSILTQGLLVRRAVPRFGEKRSALAGIGLTDRQAHAGRRLFALREIGLGAQREGLALDGGDPLVARRVGPLVQGHDEGARAEQGPGAGARETVRDLGDAVGVVAAIAAQAAIAVVVGDHIGHRTVALSLDDQTPLELQVGADQRRQSAGLAEQIGDGLGIVVAREDFIDRAAQAGQPTAHGRAFEGDGGGVAELATARSEEHTSELSH